MPAIRCKFRVIERTVRFNQNATVRLLPVNAKHHPEDPEGSDENARYWRATPSGEMIIPVRADDALLVPDACFYIDVEPVAEGQPVGWAGGVVDAANWVLTNSKLGGSLGLRFNPQPYSGHLEMSIDNPVAILMMLPTLFEEEQRIHTWRAGQPASNPWAYPPAKRWRITLTPAE